MKWIIKNPAPTDSRMEKWGDFHFGRCLGKYLERLGHEVVSHHPDHWTSRERADVVLHLRGKYPLPRGGFHRGATHVIWNMSHPESVTLDEYREFDLVLVASRPWAEELGRRIAPPVVAMLQCTDHEEFYERELPPGEDRQGFVFVGNTREVRRDCVLWAIEYGLPLRIWGRGWSKWVERRYVVADYYPNEELGQLYSSARVSLNDHWPDMREFGFINNRIFDALACGLPVLSDHHPALADEFPDEILYYSSRDELAAGLEECLLGYPGLYARTQRAKRRVLDEFTFARRAETLVELVSGISRPG